MDKVKQFLNDAYDWVVEKAMYSWTMRGVVLGVLIELADNALKFLPEEVQGTPKVVVFAVVIGILRSRTM